MKEESKSKNGQKAQKRFGGLQIQLPPECRREHEVRKVGYRIRGKRQNTFHQKAIFGGTIKMVKIDKATMDYYIRLTEFHKQFRAVGNNYNQVVRAIKTNFGEKRAMSLLYKLEKMTLELMLLTKKL